VCCLDASSLPEVDKLDGAACTSSVDVGWRSAVTEPLAGDTFRPLYMKYDPKYFDKATTNLARETIRVETYLRDG